MSKISYEERDGKFYICVDDAILLTPRKREVTTLYRPIAERIVADLKKYGYSYHEVESILTWHFAAIDNLAPFGHEMAVENLSRAFLNHPDWTFTRRTDSEWKHVLGSGRIALSRYWTGSNRRPLCN